MTSLSSFELVPPSPIDLPSASRDVSQLHIELKRPETASDDQANADAAARLSIPLTRPGSREEAAPVAADSPLRMKLTAPAAIVAAEAAAAAPAGNSLLDVVLKRPTPESTAAYKDEVVVAHVEPTEVVEPAEVIASVEPAEIVAPIVPNSVIEADGTVVFIEPVVEPAAVSRSAKKRDALKKQLFDLDTRAIEGGKAVYVSSKEQGKKFAGTVHRLGALAITPFVATPDAVRLPSVNLNPSPKAPRSKDILKGVRTKAAAAAAGATALGQSLNRLDDKAFEKKDKFVEKLKGMSFSGVKDATLKTHINTFNKLDEALYQRKALIGGAAGILIVSAVAYLSYKGLIDPTETIQAASESDSTSGAAGASGAESADSAAAQSGAENAGQADQVPAKETPAPAAEAPAVGKTVVVEQGDGFVDLIKDEFAENGVELTGADGYEKYLELDALLDGNLITGDTYEMANGDAGISSPGNFAWQEAAQRALDEMIEAEKKAKGLS